MHIRDSFPLFRSLFTRTTATWPLPSNEGCRPPYTTSKDFRRVLGGNARGDPWCERPTRYIRFQNQWRCLDPSANILKTMVSWPSANISKPTAMFRTRRQYLKPNCDISKLAPMFQNQPWNREINASISNQAPTSPDQQWRFQTNSNISTPAPIFQNQQRRLKHRPTSQISQPQARDILNPVPSIRLSTSTQTGCRQVARSGADTANSTRTRCTSNPTWIDTV